MSSKPAYMSEAPEEFYTAERWQNWLDRLREEEIDPEDEDSARLLLNLQDDAAIAVVKILTAFDDDILEPEEAIEEVAEVREIVLAEVEMEDEDAAMLIEGIQTSLMCVFLSAEQYITDGPATDTSIEAYIDEAQAAEENEEIEESLFLCAQAGTRIIDGDTLDIGIVEELDFGFVAEWVNGLDSLANALSDPEVVEE